MKRVAVILLGCILITTLLGCSNTSKDTETAYMYMVEIDGQTYYAESQEEIDSIIDEVIYGDLNDILSNAGDFIDTDETGKPLIEIESGTYLGVTSGDFSEYYFKVRNISDEPVHTITIDVDILDEFGDIVDSTHPQESSTLQPGQALNIDCITANDRGGIAAIVSSYSLKTIDGDFVTGRITQSPKVEFNTVEYNNSSDSNELSAYTYDEYVMYSNMTIGYSYVLDALKNPKSAEFLGISYNPEANVAYFCVLAENDFGGTTKSYISYSAKYDSISESDDLKYDYDSAEINRTLDDLYAFMDAIENADESDVPTPTVNESLDAYSTSDREMYELLIAGIDELSVFYEDLLIIGYKYSTDTKNAYFYFTGEDFGGTSVMTYASYSDGLGLMPSDAYKALYENADIEVYSFEIAEYEEAIKKDISK